MIKEIATLKNDNAKLNKEIVKLTTQLKNTSVLNSCQTSNSSDSFIEMSQITTKAGVCKIGTNSASAGNKNVVCKRLSNINRDDIKDKRSSRT